MANRQLLPIEFKDEFERWLMDHEYVIHQPRDFFEVIRAKKDGKWLLVFTRMNAKNHLSVMEKDCHIVRQFLRERREKRAGYQKMEPPNQSV